jgi:small-conductance mechanosensitive channel
LVLGLGFFLRRRVRLLRLFPFSLTAAAVALGLWVFLRLQPQHAARLDAILLWLVSFSIVAALLRVGGVYYFEVYLQTARGLRLPPLLVGVSFLFAYFVVGLLLFRVAFPDVGITPVLATSAVTSLVLGLALQPILGNFFAGLVITVERPFRINDWVKVAGTDGRVVDITWRTTHVRTRDNDNLIIPNGRIAEQEILNYFYPHPLHMERLYVGLHYSTPPYRAERALLDAASRVDGLVENPSAAVYLVRFDDSAIVYELRVWTEDIAGLPRIRNQCHREIWEELRRSGITIPYPIRTLELEPRARTLEVVTAATPTVPEVVAGLWVVEGPDRGKGLKLLDDKAVVVGRSSQCNLSLSEPQVSKEHFRLERDGDAFVLQDLSSTLGTTVNGERVERRALRDLDRIAIGETVLVFEHHA